MDKFKCLFCTDDTYFSSALEDTEFNGKTFAYVKCSKCGLVQVFPLPNHADLMQMYPPEYQGALDTENLERFQPLLDEIKQTNHQKIIDFDCGGGGMVALLKRNGYEAYGVEFNLDLVKKLN